MSREGQRESLPPDPHELAQLRRFAKLSFAEKVRWLEAAHRLALKLGARKAPSSSLPRLP